jgi:hypothetical protein
MKRFKLLFIMALLVELVSIAFAQETIPSEDAAKFIGQQKTVCGTVASAHFAAKTKGQPTLILISTKRIPTKCSQCLFVDLTGTSLKSRLKHSNRGKRFV